MKGDILSLLIYISDTLLYAEKIKEKLPAVFSWGFESPNSLTEGLKTP